MKLDKEVLLFVYNLTMETMASGGNINTLYNKLSEYSWGNMSEVDKQATIVTTMSIVAGLVQLTASQTNDKRQLAFSAALNGSLAYQSAELVGMQMAEGKYFDAFSSTWTYVGGLANASAASIQLKGGKSAKANARG